MATLLGAAWAVLHESVITEGEAEDLIEIHRAAINELASAHDEDDSAECLAALLQYDTGQGLIGGLIAATFNKDDRNETDVLAQTPKHILAAHGIRLEDDGLLVANSHRGTEAVFQGTLWEERGWATALARLPGARREKQKRFSEGVRSLCTWIPRALVLDDPDE